MPRRALLRPLAGGLAGALLLAGCQSGAAPSPSAAGSDSASATPAAPRPRPPSGLTGFAAGIGRPQLAVKIDNTRPAHPQVGLAAADIVYVEQVEGQLTRLLAIYSSRLPAEIGPVRSARETDLDLLRQYGRVDFAFSGANRGVLRRIAAAPVNDVSALTVPAAYQRLSSRRLPYNLFLKPGRALAAAPAARASDVGLRFSATVPTGGRARTGFSLRFGPSAAIAVRYDSRRRTWSVLMDGRREGASAPAAPVNVIVQYVLLRNSRFHDVLGNITPFTVSVGTGAAVVFRDGRALPARWSRPRLTDGTRFLAAGGADIPLRPGPTWILLVRAGTPLGP